MYKSVFRKIMHSGIVILIAVVVFIALAASAFLNIYVTKTRVDMAKNASKTIEGITATLISNSFDSRSIYFYNNSLYTISDALSSDITVINEGGEVFSSTNQTKNISPKYSSAVLSGKTVAQRGKFGGQYDKDVYIVGLPLKYNGQIIGGIFFNTEISQINNGFFGFLLFVIAACITALTAAAILILTRTKRSVVTPLRELNTAVLEIASGNFQKRLPTGNDEIGQLSSSFNHMAASLEKLDNMRNGFISDVSHELRTPMTSITGFVGGILDGTVPPEKTEEYLRIVYNESRRLTKMTNDMLEMSKMNSSQFKLEVSAFDINELIRLCIIQFEQKISDKRLDIDITMPDEKLMVLADKNAIQQVIINLLDNAIKFSYENTTITISVAKKATKAYVSVGNLGIGIDDKDIGSIFDRFYKGDKSRSGDKLGAGLGLSLAKNIMKHHKQEIWAESVDAGNGSRFTKFSFSLELS